MLEEFSVHLTALGSDPYCNLLTCHQSRSQLLEFDTKSLVVLRGTAQSTYWETVAGRSQPFWIQQSMKPWSRPLPIHFSLNHCRTRSTHGGGVSLFPATTPATHIEALQQHPVEVVPINHNIIDSSDPPEQVKNHITVNPSICHVADTTHENICWH